VQPSSSSTTSAGVRLLWTIGAVGILGWAILDGSAKRRLKEGSIRKEYSLTPLQDVVLEHKFSTRFVFHIGIEGTGHHLLGDLLPKSPPLQNAPKPLYTALKKLHRLSGKTVDYSRCDDEPEHLENKTQQFHEYVQAFVEVQDLLTEYFGGDDAPFQTKGRPLSVPLNAFLRNTFESSYPNSPMNCRYINYPDLDVIYAACEAANVQCAHVYLYRDPYQVVKSSTYNRDFNKNVLVAAKLYTTMLGVIHMQLSAYDDHTLGCWNLLKPKNTTLAYDEEFAETFYSMRDLYWGPEYHAEFDRILNSTLQPHTSKEDVEAYRRSVVPPEQDIAMQSMVRAHNRVVALCRALTEKGRSHVEGSA
jgi:hypothetical protein